MMGFGIETALFPGGPLKKAICTSPKNPVDFNQSGHDFENPEVFLILSLHQMFSQQSVEV